MSLGGRTAWFPPPPRRATSFQEARALVRQVDEARWAMEVHRTSQPRSSTIDFAQRLLDAIDPPRGSTA